MYSSNSNLCKTFNLQVACLYTFCLLQYVSTKQNSAKYKNYISALKQHGGWQSLQQINVEQQKETILFMTLILTNNF